MSDQHLNSEYLQSFVERDFDENILPALKDFIRIPNQSPNFDTHVLTNGYMEQALSLIVHWIEKQNINGLNLEVMRIEGKTPLIFVDIDSTIEGKKGWKKNVPIAFLYGHADKQPPAEGWADGLSPYIPVVRSRLPSDHGHIADDFTYLYGRGSNDDGYAVFSSILAVKALQKQRVPHGRIIICCEFSEESGSCDLPYYLCHILPFEKSKHIRETLGEDAPIIPKDYQGKIEGEVDLMICLDSGVGNYLQPWITLSLRGILVFEMHVSLITQGVHSGGYSGLVADSFRVSRMLLSRLEDENTGEIKIKELYGSSASEVDENEPYIPKWVLQKLYLSAKLLGSEGVCEAIPLADDDIELMNDDLLQLLLNKTWRPTLTVTGAEGLPKFSKAGNVLRPRTALKLSIRLPPHVSPSMAERRVIETLTSNVPYKAKVDIKNVHTGSGWYCQEYKPWLLKSLDDGCKTFFGEEYETGFLAEGGSIPFIKVLNDCYKNAQFIVTGVAGPGSGAHGPNEHLCLEYTKKVICYVSKILSDHACDHNE
ncbi:hypothetical protein FDP41_002519 [Naegleria fowleri]|uniref:Peptidase M20 dimerisation domain-containing protein n=1 Tax=Naegleria fowleri TaxID=5763 RepID=A0A6A5C0K6_NAEFO|nr:uncharacterized protein FDP41_002519 [Naegleria fowleri]KAF0978699.1 hypothetical protein FDP41_002519 [Naegleria fowleri]